MNPLFKLSTVVVALGIALGVVAAPLRAAPDSSAPAAEVKIDRGVVRRRVPTSVHSSGLLTIEAVSRLRLHPHYVEVFYRDYQCGPCDKTVVILREDFLDLTGRPL
jgi:hypothetical protein